MKVDRNDTAMTLERLCDDYEVLMRRADFCSASAASEHARQCYIKASAIAPDRGEPYAGLGIVSAPMSFSVSGKQYVSVLVGYGGTTAAYGEFMNVGWKYGAQMRRLLTFALDGKAKLAPSPPPDMTVHALDDPALVLDEDDVRAGRALWIRCASCHGVGLQSTGTPGPDLRESAISLSLDTFNHLLKNGRMEKGMPRFNTLTDEQIRQLHAYVRARAREALGIRKPADNEPAPARL